MVKVHSVESHKKLMSRGDCSKGNINFSLSNMEKKLIMSQQILCHADLQKIEYEDYLEYVNYLSQETNNMRIAMHELGILERVLYA